MSLLRSLLGARSYSIRNNFAKRPSNITTFSLTTTTTTTLTFFSFFSTSTNSLHPGSNNSNSSTIFREASPAALRRPSSQLVFLSKYEDRRKDWNSWIGYFREAGYDCIDMNIATQDKTSDLQELTEELTSQLRLLSLQRPPLVFAFHTKGSDEALNQIQSKDPRMSGLVIIVPSSEKVALEELSSINKDKMRIFVVDESQDKDAAFQNVERWMSSQGLA